MLQPSRARRAALLLPLALFLDQTLLPLIRKLQGRSP